ncbi:MAG: spermine synthase, partial [Gammaproteobacteria bacterium]
LDSDFQNVEICHHPHYGHQLVLDGDLQISTCDIAYQVSLTAPLLGRLPPKATVAILGGGDGGVLNQLLYHHDHGQIDLARATLIDIDELVIELCRCYLPNLNDRIINHPAAEIIIGDAFAFLKAQKASLDAIIYDLTMTPIHSDNSQESFSRQTLSLIASALKPSGLLSMQVCGLGETEHPLTEQAPFLQNFVPHLCGNLFKHVEQQHVRIPSFEMEWLFQSAMYPTAPI